MINGVLRQTRALKLNCGMSDMEIRIQALRESSAGFFRSHPCACPECARGRTAPQVRPNGPNVDIMNFLQPSMLG